MDYSHPLTLYPVSPSSGSENLPLHYFSTSTTMYVGLLKVRVLLVQQVLPFRPCEHCVTCLISCPLSLCPLVVTVKPTSASISAFLLCWSFSRSENFLFSKCCLSESVITCVSLDGLESWRVNQWTIEKKSALRSNISEDGTCMFKICTCRAHYFLFLLFQVLKDFLKALMTEKSGL